MTVLSLGRLQPYAGITTHLPLGTDQLPLSIFIFERMQLMHKASARFWLVQNAVIGIDNVDKDAQAAGKGLSESTGRAGDRSPECCHSRRPYLQSTGRWFREIFRFCTGMHVCIEGGFLPDFTWLFT